MGKKPSKAKELLSWSGKRLLTKEIKRLSSEHGKLLEIVEKLSAEKAAKRAKASPKKATGTVAVERTVTAERAGTVERKGAPPVLPVMQPKGGAGRPQKLAC